MRKDEPPEGICPLASSEKSKIKTMERLTIDTPADGSQLVADKPKEKKTKPRRQVHNLSIRIGKYQLELIIWKFRKV